MLSPFWFGTDCLSKTFFLIRLEEPTTLIVLLLLPHLSMNRRFLDLFLLDPEPIAKRDDIVVVVGCGGGPFLGYRDSLEFFSDLIGRDAVSGPSREPFFDDFHATNIICRPRLWRLNVLYSVIGQLTELHFASSKRWKFDPL